MRRFYIIPVIALVAFVMHYGSMAPRTLATNEKPLLMPEADAKKAGETKGRADPRPPIVDSRKELYAISERVQQVISEFEKLQPGESENESADTDPKSRYLRICRELTAQAEALRGLVAFDPALEREVAVVARQLVRFPDDEVRLAAIRLLYVLPPDPTSSRELMAGLRESVQPEVFTSAIRVLRRHRGETVEGDVNAFLDWVLVHGPFAAADEVARQSMEFIYSGNAEDFRRTLASLEPGSRRHRLLQAALQSH